MIVFISMLIFNGIARYRPFFCFLPSHLLCQDDCYFGWNVDLMSTMIIFCHIMNDIIALYNEVQDVCVYINDSFPQKCNVWAKWLVSDESLVVPRLLLLCLQWESLPFMAILSYVIWELHIILSKTKDVHVHANDYHPWHHQIWILNQCVIHVKKFMWLQNMKHINFQYYHLKCTSCKNAINSVRQ